MTAAVLERQPLNDFAPTVEGLSVYYSVENELETIRKFNELGIPQESQRFYLRENVLKLLGEFVGKVPYTKVSFRLTPDGFEYAGINMSDSYRRAAEAAGPGSREEAEWEGYQKIQQAFLDGATAVTWISPPKIADYSFAFRFHYDPYDNRVDEYPLSYPEQKGTIARSSELLSLLDDNQQFSNLLEFIRNPVQEFTAPEVNLKALLFAAEIDIEAIEVSQEFEKKLREKLSSWINKYISEILAGDYSRAENTLRAIYTRAEDIREGKDKVAIVDRQNLLYSTSDNDIFSYYSSRPALVIGGGSCPTVKRASDNPFSPTNLIDSLAQGKTIEGIFSESDQKFTCPNCHQESTPPIGDKCPKCEITKEEWAKMGGKTC